MDDLGTMLGVWAHPDDETYLTAGLMAQAVRDGRRVVCVTATRGEGGSMDEERWPSATMGEVREAELMRCFEILGVTEHHWLDELGRRHGHPTARGRLRAGPRRSWRTSSPTPSSRSAPTA